MDFSTYMKNLPNTRREKVLMLAKACCVNETSVYRWITGVCTPDSLKKKTIAETLGIPEEELFPETLTNNENRRF